MRKIIFLCALAVVTWSGVCLAEDICSTPVMTVSGEVRGLSEAGTNTCVWRGIPYAAAPVENLRWSSPQPAYKWSGVRDATEWGARCMQRGLMEAVNADPSKKMSEDCLFLNIWRPNKPGKFPVMVWIHGGGYYGGTGNTKMYWGDRLSEAGDVVVVTLNYRLNIFGFFATPGLRAEDQNKSTGSQGSLDQVAALRWVHENIGGFGGDPGNVTIFGESAGGWSICTMLATPLNKGMFQKAILESGGCESSENLEDGYKRSSAMAEKLGCRPDDLNCLRNLPAKEILKKTVGDITTGIDFLPHHDGYLLTETPLAMIRAGNFNRVPFMAGSNFDEFGFAVFFMSNLKNAKPADYEKKLKELFKLNDEESRRLAALYPLSKYDNRPKEAFHFILGVDSGLACPTYTGLDAVSRQLPDTYLYRFDYHGYHLGKRIGAMHSMEIPFIFNTMDRAPVNLLYDQTNMEEARALSRIIQGYWVNFAKNGNPNGQSLPQWSRYDPGTQSMQVLDTNTRTEPAATADRCQFWDEYTKTHPQPIGAIGESTNLKF